MCCLLYRQCTIRRQPRPGLDGRERCVSYSAPVGTFCASPSPQIGLAAQAAEVGRTAALLGELAPKLAGC